MYCDNSCSGDIVMYHTEVSELIKLDDLEKFLSDVDELMLETGVPIFPLMLPCFCFIPHCVFAAPYGRRRVSELERWVN